MYTKRILAKIGSELETPRVERPFGSGWLSDRYDNRWLLFWYYGLRGLSLLYLPFTGFTFYGLSLFAMFYGLDWIATVPPTVKLTVGRFGRERANLVFGWIFAGHQLGAGTAAFGAGLVTQGRSDGSYITDQHKPREQRRNKDLSWGVDDLMRDHDSRSAHVKRILEESRRA